MIRVGRTLKMMNKINPPHHLRVMWTQDTIEVTLDVRALRATPPHGNQHAPLGARTTVYRKIKRTRKKNGSTLVVGNLRKSPPTEAMLIIRHFRPLSEQSRSG